MQITVIFVLVMVTYKYHIQIVELQYDLGLRFTCMHHMVPTMSDPSFRM